MTEYELIMCIVNAGFSDTVMSAAKDHGARGGTVISARGTASKQAEMFFKITIQPEKEIVMILVPTEMRDAILHAVYQAAGLQTAGQGISFSLPVTNVVGLKKMSEQEIAAILAGEKPDKPDEPPHDAPPPPEDDLDPEARAAAIEAAMRG